jgi:hypothetical protein
MESEAPKIRQRLESQNEYKMSAIQSYYDSKSKRFWFLVHNTVLLYLYGDIADDIKNEGDDGVLKYFRESILPRF